MADENEVTPANAEGSQAGGTSGSESTQQENPYIMVKRRGQEVSLTKDQAAQYASKGLDYETKNAELKVERERLQEYKQFDEMLQADPRRREAVRQAFEDPEKVLGSGGQQAGGDGDGEEPAPRTPSITESPEYQTMRRELEGLKAKDQQRDVMSAQQVQHQQIDQALGGFEFLSGKETALKLAKDRAADLLAKDKSLPVDAAVGAAVNEVTKVLMESQSKQLTHQGRQQAMRSIPPSAGSPVPGQGAERPKYHKGRVQKETHKAMMEDAKAYFPRAFGLGE